MDDDDRHFGLGEALPEEPSFRSASRAHAPLPPSNIGFQLLLKMGWGGLGTGLGRDGRGRAEPLELGDVGDSRIGLGKAELERAMGDAAVAERRRMEAELQAHEGEDRRRRREERAAEALSRQQDVAEALEVFTCKACRKTYRNGVQYLEHLSSYDHAHVVREMERREAAKAMNAERAGAQEQRQAKELQRQIERARAADGQAGARAPHPPPPPPPPPAEDSPMEGGERPPLPSEPGPEVPPLIPAAPVTFALKLGGGGGVTEGGMFGLGGNSKLKAAPPPAKKLKASVFGPDSDEEG